MDTAVNADIFGNQYALNVVHHFLFCKEVVMSGRVSIRESPSLLRGKEKEMENATLAAIVDSSEDAIISKTLDGTVATWNPAAQRIFGYTSQEAVGESIQMLIPPELLSQEQHILAKLRRGERVEHLETTRITKSGKRIDVLLTSSPIRDYSGRIIGASKIARDITRQKMEQLAMRQQQLAMEHMARHNTTGEMATGLAHELSQPLACILTYAASSLAMVQSGDAKSQPLQTALAEVVSETRRASDIISRLRDFIQKRGPVREPVDINHLVTHALHLLECDLRQADIRVNLKLGSDLPILCVDRVQLMQVFVNLLCNARDAMARTASPDRKLKIVSEIDDDAIRVDVIDSGCGAAPDQIERLFDRFYSTKPDGLGMGLAISRRIVESLDGELTAANNKNSAGMTFSVKLHLGRDQ
jgi:PAS domain S-box-containing protein